MKKLLLIFASMIIFVPFVAAKGFEARAFGDYNTYLVNVNYKQERHTGAGFAVSLLYRWQKVALGVETGFLDYYAVLVPDDPETPLYTEARASQNMVPCIAFFRSYIDSFYTALGGGGYYVNREMYFKMDDVELDNSAHFFTYGFLFGLGYEFSVRIVAFDCGLTLHFVKRDDPGFDKVLTLSIGAVIRFGGSR